MIDSRHCVFCLQSRESDLGRERNEFMQEERRRKEAEGIAEDLFHNEKAKFSCYVPYLLIFGYLIIVSCRPS